MAALSKKLSDSSRSYSPKNVKSFIYNKLFFETFPSVILYLQAFCSPSSCWELHYLLNRYLDRGINGENIMMAACFSVWINGALSSKGEPEWQQCNSTFIGIFASNDLIQEAKHGHVRYLLKIVWKDEKSMWMMQFFFSIMERISWPLYSIFLWKYYSKTVFTVVKHITVDFANPFLVSEKPHHLRSSSQFFFKNCRWRCHVRQPICFVSFLYLEP